MFQEVLREAGKDRWFYTALGLYLIATLVTAVALGATHRFMPLLYVPRSLLVLGILAGMLVFVVTVMSVVSAKPHEAFKAHMKAYWTPHHLSALIMFMALALLHGVFTSTKSMLPLISGFAHDRTFADLDAAIFGQDPWLYLRWMEPFTAQIQFIYGSIWVACMLGVSMIACFSESLIKLRRQYVWTFLLCWVILGNVIALWGMSAGPVFYQNVTGDPRFVELVQNIELHRDGGAMSAAVLKDFLWHTYVTNAPGAGSGISAFPSMHLAMATLFVLFMRRVHWALGFLFSGFLLIILAGSVHLAWHYAIDGLFSIVATIGIWWAVGWALREKPGSLPIANTAAA